MYLLGLSYGAVSLALEALGTYLSKTTTYEAVQAAALYLSGPVLVRTGQGDRTGAERVPGMKRQQVFAGLCTPATGSDVTSVKVNGQWLPMGLTVDDISGLVLTAADVVSHVSIVKAGFSESR